MYDYYVLMMSVSWPETSFKDIYVNVNNYFEIYVLQEQPKLNQQ